MVIYQIYIYIYFNYSLHHGVYIGIPTVHIFIIIIYLISQSQPFLWSQLQSSAGCWYGAMSWEYIPYQVSSRYPRCQGCSARTAPFLGLCPLPIENIGEVILFPVVGFTPNLVSPAVIMGAIFNVSFDLIGLQKIELFLKICEIICRFLTTMLGLLKISL